MTDDPLSRLRCQLVDAAAQQAAGASSRRERRWKRPALWSSLVIALIGVPTAATATGVLDLTSSGKTSDGATYTFGYFEDDQASTDPSVKDGVGRACDTLGVTGADGKPAGGGGMGCRPRNAVLSGGISAGHSLLPASQELVLTGTTTVQATKVEVLGVDRTIDLLAPSADKRRRFAVLVPIGMYTVVAYDGEGRELGRVRAGMSDVHR